MGLITEKVKVSLHSSNIGWFEEKGYIIPKRRNKWRSLHVETGTEIIVNTRDLPPNSRVKIKYKCDECHGIKEISWAAYTATKKDKDNTHCLTCVRKLYGGENTRKSRLVNGTSFEQWSIENDRKDILDRWDYKLNKHRPDEISCNTCIKCWIKCPRGIHKSELRSIVSLTSRNNGNLTCSKCNSIGQWLLDKYGDKAIVLYWSTKNIVNPFEVSYGSKTKVWIICQNCGTEKEITCSTFVWFGLGCSKCSDGISYPEKIMYSILEQLSTNFQTQLSKTTFKWCKDIKYDFYLPSLNCIIETHGIQHYEATNRKDTRSLQGEQENDRYKEQMAKENGIEHYIVIDARYSELEWIKNSIYNSDLIKILNIDHNDIDWLQCERYACHSLLKKACEQWKLGTHSSLEISENLKISRTTIIRYLKKGAINGWCDYNPQEAKEKIWKFNSIKIYCIELDKCFDSIVEAAKELNVNQQTIASACKDINRAAYGYHWIYYDNYLKLYNKEKIS